MAIYGVFDSTNMKSVHRGGNIFDAIATTDIENGTFGYLGGVADGERVVYNFKPGVKAGKTIVVVDQPVWTEDECKTSNQRRDKFINEAGTKFRVREIAKNDKFGISAECVTADTVEKLDVGAYLTIDAATGKLVAADATTPDSAMEAIVEYKDIVGGTIVTSAHNYGYSRTMFKARVEVLA